MAEEQFSSLFDTIDMMFMSKEQCDREKIIKIIMMLQKALHKLNHAEKKWRTIKEKEEIDKARHEIIKFQFMLQERYLL